MAERTVKVWQEVLHGLRAFVRKRVDHDAEVEDILQEVFLRVHRHIAQLQDPERLLAWIYQITRHVIIDYYRAPGRRREILVGLAADLQDGNSDAPDRESNARAELSGCIRPMLERLSPEYREAITLVELDGLTHQEAAGKMGLSIPGMKSRVQRGRRQLKKLLDECCLIQLDRRRGVTDYELRRPDSCK